MGFPLIRMMLVAALAALMAPSALADYNIEATAAYADSNCATGSSKCAEFVFSSLKAGGLYPDTTAVSMAWVPNLITFLTNNGWTAGPAGKNNCKRGDVVLYAEAQTAPGCKQDSPKTASCPNGPMAHVALAQGNGKNWQHNSNSCSSPSIWRVPDQMLSNTCYSPPANHGGNSKGGSSSGSKPAPAPAPMPTGGKSASKPTSGHTSGRSVGNWLYVHGNWLYHCVLKRGDPKNKLPRMCGGRVSNPPAPQNRPSDDATPLSEPTNEPTYEPTSMPSKAKTVPTRQPPSKLPTAPTAKPPTAPVPVPSKLPAAPTAKPPPAASPMPSKGSSSATTANEFIDVIFPWVLLWEGTAYTNDPSDAGGSTKFGISFNANKAALAKFGITSGPDIKNLTLEQARSIYLQNFWAPVAGGLPYPMSWVYFNAAVNNGPGAAAKFYQQSGGSVTSFINTQEDYYRAIVASKPDQAKFLKGWLNRVDSLRKCIDPATYSKANCAYKG